MFTEMVKEVKKVRQENPVMTLGMFGPVNQALALHKQGLDYYNHNLGHLPLKFYGDVLIYYSDTIKTVFLDNFVYVQGCGHDVNALVVLWVWAKVGI